MNDMMEWPRCLEDFKVSEIFLNFTVSQSVIQSSEILNLRLLHPRQPGSQFLSWVLVSPGDSLPCFLSPAKSLEAFQLRCNARKKRGEIKDTQLFKLEPVSAMRLHLHRINNWQKSLQDVLWHLSSFTEHQEQNVFQSFWVKKSLRLNNSEIELMSNINGFM